MPEIAGASKMFNDINRLYLHCSGATLSCCRQPLSSDWSVSVSVAAAAGAGPGREREELSNETRSEECGRQTIAKI